MELIGRNMALEDEYTQGLILFLHINRQGSLAATAQLLGMSSSSVSKQLTALERKIGSKLFNRTTRKIVLTKVGHQVLKEAHKVELALQTISQISEDSQSVIAGDINISCASAQGRIHLVPLLTAFIERYPQINLNLQLEDRFIDMVAEKVDISIRVGYLPDSTVIARKLGEISGVLCASPEYLRKAPPLTCPSDLLQHRCLFYRNPTIAMNSWSFTSEHGEETIIVNGPLSINDPSALVTAALAHSGVILMDKSLLGDTLKNGQLVPVLTDYQLVGNLPMYLVYPSRELVPARTKALVDFLVAEMPAVLTTESLPSD